MNTNQHYENVLALCAILCRLSALYVVGVCKKNCLQLEEDITKVGVNREGEKQQQQKQQ